MAFKSSAYSVVARIFKLIDSNGFTRLFFGPLTILTHLGYALRYEDSVWTNANTESGIWFGTDSAPDTAEVDIYAHGSTTNQSSDVIARSVQTGVTKSQIVSLLATEDSAT